MGTDTYQFGAFDDRLRSITHSIGLVVGSFAAGTVLVLFAFALLGAAGVGVERGESVPVLVSVLTTALQFVGFYVVCLGYLRWRAGADRLFDISLPSARDLGWVLLAFVGLLVGVNVISVVLAQLGVTPATNSVVTQGERSPVYFLYLIPIAFLLNGPAEELLFRGLVQGLFRRAYGVVPGILIAAGLFGAVHITAVITSGGSTQSMLATLGVAALLGVLLGAVYERTQNLLVPMLAHGVYNAFLFSLNYLRVTGQLSLPT